MPASSQNGMTDVREWLKGLWPGSFAQGLESMLGSKVEFECLPLESSIPASGPSDPWWRVEFTNLGGAPLYVGATAEVADQIGRAALKAVGVEDASAEDAKGTYQEIVGQSLSAIAQGLSRESKKDIACINGKDSKQPANPSFILPVKLICSLEESGPIYLIVSKEFAAIFAPPPAAVKVDSYSTSTKTMDLLFDVELPVSVSFGRTQLALKDVIKLTTGSIVELNRSIVEPVEVIVNNCVIARGEVVVIEGNYGVRIQQIISRQERLRTLN